MLTIQVKQWGKVNKKEDESKYNQDPSTFGFETQRSFYDTDSPQYCPYHFGFSAIKLLEQ